MRTALIAASLAGCTLLIGSTAQAAAARHYDCSKAGNANKAACKGATAASAPASAAASTTTPAKKPSLLDRLRGHPAATPAAAPAAANTNQAPAAAPEAAGHTGKSVTSDPAGATGQCKDGSYTHATHHSGACSRHGGVAKWMNS